MMRAPNEVRIVGLTRRVIIKLCGLSPDRGIPRILDAFQSAEASDVLTFVHDADRAICWLKYLMIMFLRDSKDGNCYLEVSHFPAIKK
jgi:hypothetical protein